MPALDHALVRILYPDASHPLGGGILISPRHVLTCAHVVADAPGLERGQYPDDVGGKNAH